MKAIIEDNYVRIIVLDISGIYAQIYEQGYFKVDSIGKIEQKYSDSKLWNVIILDT